MGHVSVKHEERFLQTPKKVKHGIFQIWFKFIKVKWPVIPIGYHPWFIFYKSSFQNCNNHFMKVRQPCCQIRCILKTITRICDKNFNTTGVIFAFKTGFSIHKVNSIILKQELWQTWFCIFSIEISSYFCLLKLSSIKTASTSSGKICLFKTLLRISPCTYIKIPLPCIFLSNQNVRQNLSI